MPKIEIEWLSDDHDCETCGLSYACWAKVLLDGEPLLELEPLASCYGGANYEIDEVFVLILRKLGYEVEGYDLSPELSQADILKAVQEKSRQIAIQQAKADAGEFKSYGGAIGLQRLKMDRAALMGRLDKPRLAVG